MTADPAFKTYTDTYFITKKEHERRLQLTVKTIGETLGDILKPHLDRIAELEAFVALQRAGAAAHQLSNPDRADSKAISGGRP